MKRVLGILLAGGTGVMLLLLMLLPAGAAGNGPAIGPGTVTATKVPVYATTAAADPYKGFNIHVKTAVSAGVTQGSIVGSVAGSTILDAQDVIQGTTASVFCSSATPAPDEKVFACTALNRQTTSAAGLLATLTVNGTGNGCIDVRLFDLLDTDPAASTDRTYTINATPVGRQVNAVDQATVKHVFIGTGTIADCPGFGAANTPTNTAGPVNTATNTPVPTNTATNTTVPATTPTNTTVPVNTPTNTAVPVSTSTAAPATPTASPTATPCAGLCPTPAATNTPSGGYPAPTGNCTLAMTATALVGRQTPISVTVLDANGAPVAGATVDFSIVRQPGTDATVKADALLTDALGVVTGTVSVGTAPGVVQILATAPTVSCGGSIVVSTG